MYFIPNRFSVIVIIILLPLGLLFPQRLSKETTPAILQGWKSTDANTVGAAISNDGVFADYWNTASPGLHWPKGTQIRAVYSSGLWIVGKHKPSDSLRTAVMYYQSEFRPGKIISTFNTSTNDPSAADDPAKPEYHLYKITRGIKDADYFNWPGDLGAPYHDLNNNGVWDKG
ncbi:MAG: hypothetical protein WCW35_15665, partial [Bacteroidota bacterium]